ncbi:hypothetical protein [Peptostreptococcus faecalis]|uniref:hypothetical protein n=1 Tax=Peptostreptococcus faecalis TaxID=2045015 RepID=UPI000C7C74A4|nr:hypothetical protein [Peptostreptococcus faecalis]
MSGLIKKNNKKDPLERVPVPQPKNTFSRDSLFTIDEAKKETKVKKETTTIRCDKDVADKINAMTVILNYETVNELLTHAIEELRTGLSGDQKKEFETIKNVYSKKRAFKK